MSHISSKIESIEKITFEPITAKAIKVTKITSVNGTIVALGADGKIYTTGVVGHVAYSLSGHDGKLGRVLDGCIKLGALSSSAVRQHKNHSAKLAAERERKWNSERFVELAESLGIALTDDQKQSAKGSAS